MKKHARNTIVSFAVLLAPGLSAHAVVAQSPVESTSRPIVRPLALTEADVSTAIRVLNSLREGQQIKLHASLETDHMPPERWPQVVSAIYVLLVDLKYAEIKKKRDFWLTRWFTSSGADKAWLIETKPRIDSYVTQLFGERGVQYTAARRLVKAKRKELEQVLYLKPCK